MSAGVPGVDGARLLLTLFFRPGAGLLLPQPTTATLNDNLTLQVRLKARHVLPLPSLGVPDNILTLQAHWGQCPARAALRG